MSQGDEAINLMRDAFRLRNTQGMRTFLRGFIRLRLDRYKSQNPGPSNPPPAINPLPVATRNVDIALDQSNAIQAELQATRDELAAAHQRYDNDMSANNAAAAAKLEEKVNELKVLQDEHDKTVTKLEQIRQELAESDAGKKCV